MQSYGLVQISFDNFLRPKIVTLSNIAYVPDFLTNVAALEMFTAKGVHFNSFIPHMHTQSNIIFHIYRLGRYYTFTNT